MTGAAQRSPRAAWHTHGLDKLHDSAHKPLQHCKLGVTDALYGSAAGRGNFPEEVQSDGGQVAQPQGCLVCSRPGAGALGPCGPEDVCPHLRLHPGEGAAGHAILL